MLQVIHGYIPEDIPRAHPAGLERRLEPEPHAHLHLVLGRLHRQAVARGQDQPGHELHVRRVGGGCAMESVVQFDLRSNRQHRVYLIFQSQAEREQASAPG